MKVDPCFAELLAEPRNTVRPPPAHVPMSKVRRAADGAMAQGQMPQMAAVSDAHVRVNDREIPIRHYRPTGAIDLPVIVFCHGGGFVWGSIDTHDGLCRRLAAQTGAAVVSVGYRLAPETPFPGPVDDVFGVLRHLVQAAEILGIDPQRIALCGDSAGGQIAASVTVMAGRAGINLRHLALIYPALDPTCNSDSQLALAEGPLLTRAAMQWFWSCYLGPTPPEPGHLHDVLNAELGSFPPTTIATAECDLLRNEGEAFAAKLSTNGTDVLLHAVLETAIITA